MNSEEYLLKSKNDFSQAGTRFLDIWFFKTEISSAEAASRMAEYYPELAKAGISYSKYGKPLYERINFGFSNTRGLSAAAVSNYSQVGIDCEEINPGRKRTNTLVELFTENEKNMIRNTDDFYKIWTIKEAVTKYNGSSVWFSENIATGPEHLAEEKKWNNLNSVAVWSTKINADYYLTAAVYKVPEELRFFSL